MLLHQLGRDGWTVLAVARTEAECELQMVLAEPDANDLGIRMLALLRQQLPTSGPPHNEEVSKQLDGDIYEFRKTPKRGPALRVLWFYDEGRIVVCTHGFWKTTQRTPPAEIEKAKKLRKEYLLPSEATQSELFLRMGRQPMTKKARKLIATAERSPLYWAEAAWLQFTEDLNGLMQSQNVTRAELARRLGVSPAYITKVFRGTVNLTLESMCRLTLALDASPRLHVAAIDKLTRWADVPAVNEVRTEFVFAHQLRASAPYRVASVTSDSPHRDTV